MRDSNINKDDKLYLSLTLKISLDSKTNLL